MELKLGLFDLAATVSAKKNERVYRDILIEAWNASKISARFKQVEIQKGKFGYPNDENHLAMYSNSITADKLRIYFGFWFNHENKPTTFESHSKEFPILFVAIMTDKQEKDVIVENLQQREKLKILGSESQWKWREKNDPLWPLFAKSIDLSDLNKNDNFADFFIDKFKHELNKLNEALF